MEIKSYFEKGISYETFLKALDKDAEENKTEMLEYILLNQKRMPRVDKTNKILDETTQALEQVKGKGFKFLMLAEHWCGDVSQNLPIIQKIAQLGEIDLRLVYRDENLDLMDQYLTNGGRSIPKMLVLNEQYEVIADWGPRPKFIQDFVAEEKEKPDFDKPKMLAEVQKMYNKDKGISLQKELTTVLVAELAK